MDDPTLNVYEIFRSLQGEGTRAGLPCTFVRLAGCDLRCAWCDTLEAADERNGRVLALTEILRMVGEQGPPLVCLTGGEPLLQKAAPELAKRLCACGYTVVVETNGVQDISVLPQPIVRVMDVKTPTSRMSRHMNWYNLQHLRAGDEVKFVIQQRTDYEYARELIEKHALPDRCHVLMSPVLAEDSEVSPALLSEWMLWDDLPVRLSLQLHKLIWPQGEPKPARESMFPS